ncbi:hypothetical protein RCL1_006411 [Eukaryota sp. TZLM3-RCL]
MPLDAFQNDEEVRRELRAIDPRYTDPNFVRFASIALQHFERETLESQAKSLDDMMDYLVKKRCSSLKRFLELYNSIVREADSTTHLMTSLQSSLKSSGDLLSLTGGISDIKRLENLQLSCFTLSQELTQLRALKEAVSGPSLVVEKIEKELYYSASVMLEQHRSLEVFGETFDLNSVLTNLKHLGLNIANNCFKKISEIVFLKDVELFDGNQSILINCLSNFDLNELKSMSPLSLSGEESLIAILNKSIKFDCSNTDQVRNLVFSRLVYLIESVSLLENSSDHFEKFLVQFSDQILERIKSLAVEVLSSENFVEFSKNLQKKGNKKSKTDMISSRNRSQSFLIDTSDSKSTFHTPSSSEKLTERFIYEPSINSGSSATTTTTFNENKKQKTKTLLKQPKRIKNTAHNDVYFNAFLAESHGIRPSFDEIRLVLFGLDSLGANFITVCKLTFFALYKIYNHFPALEVQINDVINHLWLNIQNILTEYLSVHCVSENMSNLKISSQFFVGFKSIFADSQLSSLFEISNSNQVLQKLTKATPFYFTCTWPLCLRLHHSVESLFKSFGFTSRLRDPIIFSFFSNENTQTYFNQMVKRDIIKRISRIFDPVFEPFSTIHLDYSISTSSPSDSLFQFSTRPLPHNRPVLKCLFHLSLILSDLIADCCRSLQFAQFFPDPFCHSLVNSLRHVESIQAVDSYPLSVRSISLHIDSLQWLYGFLNGLKSDVECCQSFLKDFVNNSDQNLADVQLFINGVKLVLSNLSRDLNCLPYLISTISSCLESVLASKEILLTLISKIISSQISRNLENITFSQTISSKWASTICFDLNEAIKLIVDILTPSDLSLVLLNSMNSLDVLLLNIPISSSSFLDGSHNILISGIKALRSTVLTLVNSQGQVLKISRKYFALFTLVDASDEEVFERCRDASQEPLITSSHVSKVLTLLGKNVADYEKYCRK